jgi:hypothetical protein
MMARRQSPQTFEKRARERDKQQKRLAKQAERTAKSVARQQQRHEDLVASYGQKPVARPTPPQPAPVAPTVPAVAVTLQKEAVEPPVAPAQQSADKPKP